MCIVVMMRGVCGAGKTTYAKGLEKDGFVRLSIDEEIWAAYGRCGIDFPEEQYDSVSEAAEARLRGKIPGLVAEGKNIVLDFSFWSRKKRADYRKLIEEAGGQPVLIYLKADKKLLKQRLEERNRSIHANSPFVITDEILEHHYRCFQEPHGEGEQIILQK